MNSDEKNSKGLVIVYTGNGKGKLRLLWESSSEP